MDNLLVFIGLGSIMVLVVVVVLSVVSYLLSSIAIMKMAQKKGIDEAWLAWIPIGNLYLIGKLIQTIEFGGKSYEQAEYILPGAFLASIVLGRLGILGAIPNILMGLLTLYGLFMLYTRYTPEKVTKYMLFSLLIPGVGASVILFKIRNTEPARLQA